MEMKPLNKLALPEASQCIYTSCYCEENVWKLCEYVRNNQEELLPYCYAVFISNKNETIPLWMQKSGYDKDSLAVWDYHVIFLHSNPTNSQVVVYDLDSLLSFPVEFETYAALTIRSDSVLKKEYHRMFRVVPASLFLSTFASDRSRMKRPDGSWIKEPPNYPCIKTNDATNNLDLFVQMNPQVGFGEVMNLEKFLSRFSNSDQSVMRN